MQQLPLQIRQSPWLWLGAAFAAALFLAFSQPVHAIETSSPLTVEGAIREALERSPEVQRAKASVGEKQWQHFEALGSGFLPKISVSALHYFDTRYTQTSINFGGATLAFPGFYPNTQAALDITIPVFNGLANIYQLQAASLLEEAAEQSLSRSEFETSENVRLAFYQALAAEDLRQVAALNVKTLEDHLRQIKIQRQGGVATNYDTLRVEVQLNEAHADAIDAEDNAEISRKKLAQLLGMESDLRRLEGTLPAPVSDKVNNLVFTQVPQDRSDLRALALKSEAAGKVENAGKAWLVPSVYLAGEYSFYDSQVFNNVISNTGNYESAYFVGAFLKWNLFDGGVALAQMREAAYQAVQAEKTSQIERLKVPYDFAYWKRRYLSNIDHYLSKKFDIQRSEEAVRLAKEEQKAGTRTSSETLDAELDLFRARAGVVNAQVNAVEALIHLELTLGRKI